MSYTETTYSKADLKENSLRREYENDPSTAAKVVRGAKDEEAMRYLINDVEIDKRHEREQHLGDIKRAILESDVCPDDLKRIISTRGDETPDEVLVPNGVQQDAAAAINMGKPLVLYGPTGTGKTTFAKQLARNVGIGYSLNTATPSWTEKDIIGGVEPDYEGGEVSYRKELGCVSKAVVRSRDFGGEYVVIIDEITRADISRIFGKLYTAIENPHQTVFETDEGRLITLDEEVTLICTMNMSDRTVHELDDAITRRFAMVKVADYPTNKIDSLFETWMATYAPGVELAGPIELFKTDHEWLNNGSAEGEPVMEFGPMHYRDVIEFVGENIDNGDPKDGIYDDVEEAIGRAFKTYITPRLLNTASYPQVKQLVDHYKRLDEQFDIADFSPALELVQDRLKTEQQKMGARK
jgi:5-methylcytosine-specific restriction protein B